MPERRTVDYVRHGTTSLFAALNTADGTVISSLHRHRAIEFRKFLAKLDAKCPSTSKFIGSATTTAPMRARRSPPGWHHLAGAPPALPHALHPTYSSWINQVERSFGSVSTDLLQRSDHRSVQALEADIRAWIKAWNNNP